MDALWCSQREDWGVLPAWEIYRVRSPRVVAGRDEPMPAVRTMPIEVSPTRGQRRFVPLVRALPV